MFKRICCTSVHNYGSNFSLLIPPNYTFYLCLFLNHFSVKEDWIVNSQMLGGDYTLVSLPYMSICILMGPNFQVSAWFFPFCYLSHVSLLPNFHFFLDLTRFSQFNEELVLSLGFFTINILCGLRMSLHGFLEGRDCAFFSQCQGGSWHKVLSQYCQTKIVGVALFLTV